MEVATFMLKLIKAYEKSPTLPVGQETLWAPLQRICWQRKNHAPLRNWTVDIQLTAHHLT